MVSLLDLPTEVIDIIVNEICPSLRQSHRLKAHILRSTRLHCVSLDLSKPSAFSIQDLIRFAQVDKHHLSHYRHRVLAKSTFEMFNAKTAQEFAELIGLENLAHVRTLIVNRIGGNPAVLKCLFWRLFHAFGEQVDIKIRVIMIIVGPEQWRVLLQSIDCFLSEAVELPVAQQARASESTKPSQKATASLSRRAHTAASLQRLIRRSVHITCYHKRWISAIEEHGTGLADVTEVQTCSCFDQSDIRRRRSLLTNILSSTCTGRVDDVR